MSNPQARAKSGLRRAHPEEYARLRRTMAARRANGALLGDPVAAANTELTKRHAAEYRFRYLAAKG